MNIDIDYVLLLKPLFILFLFIFGIVLIWETILKITELVALSIRKIIFDPISQHFEDKKELKSEKKIKFKPTDDIEKKLGEVDQMDGEQFERFLRGIFRDLGYYTERTPRTGDYGADLILLKDGYKISVQAKRYKKPVGVKAVQEVYASLEKYVCDKGIVITNNYFTQNAKTLAESTKVELWDRDKLKEVLLTLKSER